MCEAFITKTPPRVKYICSYEITQEIPKSSIMKEIDTSEN